MTRRLAPVPDVPPRAVLYLRQSIARDDSVSLELQETACRDHCARHGYVVAEVLADPGVTGRTWKRPAVVRTLDLVESGQADVIVLWKWSRLSRSRRDWAVAADRVDVAGGRIESATEPVDVSTSTGRLTRGLLVELAAFESDRIGDVWREVHASRVAKGLAPTGKPKWGYVYADGRHQSDPVTGPLLAECYRRYVAGESVYSLVGWLNSQGARTIDSNPWSDRTLRRVMDSGFAAGFVPYRGVLHPGAHEALIDQATWAAYQAARRARRTSRRSERSQYLFSGMVRCACGSSMQAGMFGAAGTPKYRCKAAHDARRHSGGYVMASTLEAEVLAWLRGIAAEVDAAAVSGAATMAAARRARAGQDAAALAREVVALDEQLVRLTRQLASEVVPEAAYVTARDEITAARAGIEARLTAAEDAAATMVVDPAGIAADLLAEWETLPVEHRRGMLKQVVARLEVTPGRPRSRVRVVPAWESLV